MKYSQFNSLVATADALAYFNAFSQKAIFLDQALFDLLSSRPSAARLQAVHPSFYDHLLDNAFIVPDELDEVSAVRNLSATVDWDASTFMLTLNPNMTCNFGCHYCYETHVAKSRISVETIAKVQKFISNTVGVPGLEVFTLSFFGGEPLLYFRKDVRPIIDHYLHECRARDLPPVVSFTTNGYMIEDGFLDYFRQQEVRCSLQITLDGCQERHDRVRFGRSGRGSYAGSSRTSPRLSPNASSSG